MRLVGRIVKEAPTKPAIKYGECCHRVQRLGRAQVRLGRAQVLWITSSSIQQISFGDGVRNHSSVKSARPYNKNLSAMAFGTTIPLNHLDIDFVKLRAASIPAEVAYRKSVGGATSLCGDQARI